MIAIQNQLAPASDARDALCDTQSYWQNPRQYREVMTVTSKTAPVCTRDAQQNRQPNTSEKNLPASTNGHHTNHSHNMRVNRMAGDVMPKKFGRHRNHMTTNPPAKPLRQAMPTVAGMDGQPTFWAEENGQQIGTKPRQAAYAPSCSTCGGYGRPGRSRGYCGSRMDLPPAYGPNHPLRRLPEDGGTTCQQYAHYSEVK